MEESLVPAYFKYVRGVRMVVHNTPFDQGQGEIDLIAIDPATQPPTVHFCEVATHIDGLRFYGDKAIIQSRRGQIECKVVLTAMTAPGTCFVPMHFNEGPVNQLTVWAVDKFSKEPNYKQQAVQIRKA